MVVAFDGNSAAANLIQEAKNGKGRSFIYIWSHSKTLKQKAKSLQGYIRYFDNDNPIVEQLIELQKKYEKFENI